METACDGWTAVEDLVQRELEAVRPRLAAEIVRHQERRRTALRCGLVRLQLARWPEVRRRLRSIVQHSRLSVRECALALGISPSSLERHLAGRRPCGTRLAFYTAIRSIQSIDGATVVVVGAPRGRRMPRSDRQQACL